MVPAAAGHPQYSGNFIPEIWSPLLNVKYYTASIFPGIANTKYEGAIKNVGDIVNIRQRADIDIRDYEKGMDLTVQKPDKPMITFPIRKAKYYAFTCDDIDAHQTDINMMEEWSQDAGEKLKIKIDAQGLGDVYANADSYNTGATAGVISQDFDLGASGDPLQVTKENALDFLVDLNTCLDEQDVPETQRWFAIPTWLNNRLKKSDLKDVSMTGDSSSVVRHGRVGRLDNTDVHKSNQIKRVLDGSDYCYYAMAGHIDSITFAAQMREMSSVESEKTFARIVRGLMVYDYKVLKEEALVTAYIKK